MIAVIDRLLFNPVTITFNGKQTVVTAIEAIVLQLLRKAWRGGRREARAAEVSGVCSSKCEEPARGQVSGQRLHPVSGELDGGSR